MSSTSATFSPPPGPGPSSIFLYQMILPLSISLVKSSLCVFPFHSLSLCIGTTFLGTISMHFSIDLCFSLFSISTVTISWPCTYLLLTGSFFFLACRLTTNVQVYYSFNVLLIHSLYKTLAASVLQT